MSGDEDIEEQMNNFPLPPMPPGISMPPPPPPVFNETNNDDAWNSIDKTLLQAAEDLNLSNVCLLYTSDAADE